MNLEKFGQFTVYFYPSGTPEKVVWDGGENVLQRHYVIDWGIARVNNWIKMKGHQVLPITKWVWNVDRYVAYFEVDKLQIKPETKRCLILFESQLYVYECLVENIPALRELQDRAIGAAFVGELDHMTTVDSLLENVQFDLVVQIKGERYRNSEGYNQ